MSDVPITFASRLVSLRWPLLVLGVSVFAVAVPIDRRLVFDRHIERLFPENDPAAEAYATLQRNFGGNEIAVLTYPGAGLFDPKGSGLAQLNELSEQIGKIEGVKSVLSLAKVNRALGLIQPTSFFSRKSENSNAILGDTALAVSFRELFASYTHSPDGNYAALVVMLDPDRERTAEADRPISALREIVNSLPEVNQPASLVGEPVLVDEGFTLAERDGNRLGTVTLALLSVVILVMFRSPKWVITQLVIIYWSVVVTRAILAMIGLQLTLVSSMLTAVVTVIAVVSIIHIAVADRNARLRGRVEKETTIIALQATLEPIFWACLTDAVGFAALCVASVGPVRDFGIMMAIAALVVFVSIVLFVPCLSSLRFAQSNNRPLRANRKLRHFLFGCYSWLNKNRRLVMISSAVVGVLIAHGLSRLEVETNFIKNFRPDHRLAIDYGTVESHLGGAGVWDILLPAPRDLSPQYFASVRELEDKMREIKGEDGMRSLTKVLSIADADAAASSSVLLSLAPPSLRISGMRTAMPHFVNALISESASSEDERLLRIMMRSREQASASNKNKLIAEVRQTVLSHTSSEAWKKLFGEVKKLPQPQITGYFVLLSGLVAGLVQDQWYCFAIASLGVFLMLIIASRSIRLAICAMLPNVIPILAVVAGLGLWGTPVNLGTAMIAAVSIGISIDGSIHFLTAYRRNRDTHNIDQSIKRIYRTVGIAVILATVALMVGFSTLITSPFVPTSTFGLLVSVSLVASSIANLTMLPFTIRLICS